MKKPHLAFEPVGARRRLPADTIHLFDAKKQVQHLGNLLTIGRAVWPEPKRLPAAAAELLHQVMRANCSKVSSIPGML